MQKAERKQIDLLSKDVFGASSRWQKLINKGYEELVTEEVEEAVPGISEGDAPTMQKVQKPVLLNGSRQFVKKYHTVESVLEFMTEQKKQLDVLRAQIQQQRDDLLAKLKADDEAAKAAAEATRLASAVQTNISGSAK